MKEMPETLQLQYSTAIQLFAEQPGCVAQSVGHLTRKSEVLGSIPGLVQHNNVEKQRYINVDIQEMLSKQSTTHRKQR